MKTGVSKAELVKSLESTLKLTGRGVACLELSEDELITEVVIWYENGYNKRVCIECNSHIAIIRDVCRHIN